MRQSYELPQDNCSHQFHQCSPSHHEMVLMPDYVQASAGVPRPLQLLTGSPMLLAPVSPYHQQGSTKPLVAPAAHSPCHFVPFASMGGESPQARPHDCLQGLMSTLPMSFDVSTPSHSPHHFVPFVSMGGNVLCWLVICSHQQGQLDTVAKG